MPQRKSKPVFNPVCLLLALIMVFLFPLTCLAQHEELEKIIIAYNLKAYQKSLTDGTYQGEEGLLWIKPDAAKTLGLKVVMDQDYSDATALWKQAAVAFDNAKKTLTDKNKENSDWYYIKNTTSYFLEYKSSLEAAKQKFQAYHQKLTPDLDERLNESASQKTLDKLLQDCLKKANNNLRDALGLFYNYCHEINNGRCALTPDNVAFVNQVFFGFTSQVTSGTTGLYDLDLYTNLKNNSSGTLWKEMITKEGFLYADLVEKIITEESVLEKPLDPLLFIAIIRKESSFNPQAVSWMGAAGLVQIMPQTALDLGMKNVYFPDYLKEAAAIREREMQAKNAALNSLNQINEENWAVSAKQARDSMQQGLVYEQDRRDLYEKYKQDLLAQQNDDRLQPAIVTKYAYQYFCQLLKAQKGDISLALASYNAGPHRVKQYQGIPPFAETVNYRNEVLNFFRYYLSKIDQLP
jgi:hypothetical protein